MFEAASLTTLLAVLGLALAAWSSAGKTFRPLIALTGLAVFVAALLFRLGASAFWPTGIGGLFLDAGIALVFFSLILRLLRKTARAPLLLGMLALLAAAGIFGLSGLTSRWAKSDLTEKRTPVDSSRLLVELGPDDRLEEIAPILRRFDAHAERAFPMVSLDENVDLAQVYVVQVDAGRSDALAQALRADGENVDAVEPDAAVSLLPRVEAPPADAETASGYLANDPLVESQWWLAAIGADGAHRALEQIVPSRKAIVAILDTGVDSGHEDLVGVVGQGARSTDPNGHGTHVAGIAGAHTNNATGIASLNWQNRFIEIRSYAVLTEGGFGSALEVARGIVDAAQGGADVISMSLGAFSPVPPKVEVDAVRFALSRGAVVIAAAGNSAASAEEHAPSNIEGVISVAAVDAEGRKPSFSNTNAELTRPLSAPGVGIFSTKPGGLYAAHNGTSSAAPMVAGLAGILRAIDPALSPDQVYERLRTTARPTPAGEGIGPAIDASAALRSTLETRASLPTLP